MKKTKYILFFTILFIGLSSFSQSRKQLEYKRKKLQKEIQQVERIISQTKKKKNNVLDDLRDLNKKITIRKKIIETIELETNELSKEIKRNQTQIEKNNTELEALKKDYADMVFKSYKSKSQQSKLMFLLSSNNFNQAYKRLKYLEQYKDFRKKQGENIIVKIKEIEVLNDSLIKRKKLKTELLSSKEKEKKTIEGDKKNKVKLISKIKKEEYKYKRQLRAKIKEEKQIANKIDKIIREAIARANRKKKGRKSSNKLLLSTAEKALKLKFEQNKGRLPWPIDGGYITRKFGIQPHHRYKGITINSPGLHIRGKRGDVAKSVFTGKVLAVQLLSKGIKSIFIQHGDYITVYNNIEKAYVKKGDKVKTGQRLGVIFTDKVTGKTELGFILSKNTQKLNPIYWIRRK